MLRAAGFLILFAVVACSKGEDPLPSWRNGQTKTAVMEFVEAAKKEGGPGYIAPADRIAVFDNDGTLWGEQPLYFQALFAIDEAKRLAAQQPEIGALVSTFEASEGEEQFDALLKIVAATHSDVAIDEFNARTRAWLEEARHPVTGRRYDQMTYQPMVELLDYLRSAGFDVFIVSGGGADFMRAFAEDAYGVPPQNVLGSLTKARFDGTDVIKDEGIAFIDDKEGKPINIARQIGKRPVFVGGNSDGDLAMAEYAAAGSGPHFVLFVHHTDSEREVAYDRQSSVGRFDAALDRAADAGWLVVDMKNDWLTVYSPE